MTRLEALLFGAEHPGLVEELARGGAPRHFLGLPGRAQAVKGLARGVVAGGAERRPGERGAPPAVAIVADTRPAADAAPRLAEQRGAPDVGGERVGARAEGEVERADQEPGRGDQPDPGRAREARERGRPVALLE